MGKTIAQELFAIAEAQGGTIAGYPRTIAGAVDAVTDALAGSDVDSGRTIAEAVAVMGEYIGGGGSATKTLKIEWLSSKPSVAAITYDGSKDLSTLVVKGNSSAGWTTDAPVGQQIIITTSTAMDTTSPSFKCDGSDIPYHFYSSDKKVNFVMPDGEMTVSGISK